jgi:hypothetical protein
MLFTALTADAQTPLGTAFTYQGRLSDGGAPANGTYDLQFTVYIVAAGGSPVAGPLLKEDVIVSGGLFTVMLDFGAAPNGYATWIEVGVRPGASTGAFTAMAPRQEVTPTPNALYSSTAPWSGIAGKPAAFADGVDNDSGGTVTSVTAGTGLSGGTITTSGTLSVATGGISSAMIATGAVGTSQISASGSQSGQALISTGSSVSWGVPSVPLRKYGLSTTLVDGSQALTACPAGYHMATLFEIFNFTDLAFDDFGNSFSGYDRTGGPPGQPGGNGWVRTGTLSSSSDIAGVGNCNLWTSNSAAGYGTFVGPEFDWRTSTGTSSFNFVAPWRAGTTTCDVSGRVWCVQN